MAGKVCSFCHEECDMNKILIKKDYAGREYICHKCYDRTGINDFLKISSMTADEIRPYIDDANESDKRRAQMIPDKFAVGLICADSKNKYWSRLCGHLTNRAYVHEFSDILSYQIEVCGKTTEAEDIIGKTADELYSVVMKQKPETKRGLFKKEPLCDSFDFIIKTSALVEPAAKISLLKSPIRFDSELMKNAVDDLYECVSFVNEITKADKKIN